MSVAKKGKSRKAMLASGLGFIAGVGGILGFEALGGEMDWGAGRAAASAVGVIYLATGLFTLLGAASPRMGAKVLNVSDVEELVEQRAILLGSTVAVIAFGVMLLSLAGAGTGGFVPDAVALGAVAVGLVSITVVSIRQWRLYDELWRQLSWESSAFAMALMLPLLILWGAATHLGYIGSMDPLGVIAVVSAAVLAGSVVASGRRGLLVLK